MSCVVGDTREGDSRVDIECHVLLETREKVTVSDSRVDTECHVL